MARVILAHCASGLVAMHDVCDPAKRTDILDKTARKMAVRVQAPILTVIEPPPHIQPLIAQVMAAAG